MERFKVPAGKLATVYFARSAFTTPKRKGSASDVESQQSASVSVDEKMDSGKPETAIDVQPTSPPAEIVRSEKSFSWKDLSLDVKTKDGNKRLLNDVCGK